MEPEHRKIIIGSTINEDGVIYNILDFQEMVDKSKYDNIGMFFCFAIKTLIDDFGKEMEEKTGLNQEQFEAMFMESLGQLLAQNTRDKKD